MQFIIDSIRWLRAKLGWWMWAIAPLWIFIQLFLENIGNIHAGLSDINAQLTTFATGSATRPAAAQIWKNANYFFPVEAVLALALYLLQLRLVALAIRLLKSLTIVWSA